MLGKSDKRGLDILHHMNIEDFDILFLAMYNNSNFISLHLE